MSQLRIGVLVLGSGSPDVLRHLLSLWPQFSFFIHVDAKADLSRFDGVSALPHARIIPTRLPVYWGGWNMVQAELALMRAALAAGCERLVLISDDSFPLRSASELVVALADEALHLGLWEMPETDKAHVRYREYFYFDSMATGYRSHDVYRRFVTEQDVAALRDLSALRARGKAALPMLFKGPQWWCLTASAAALVLEHHDADEHLRESFRFSLIPDEHYVQTIIGLWGQGFARKPYPMWTDIARVPSPWVYTDVSELDTAMASGSLFVRKVAVSIAEQLFERLK